MREVLFRAWDGKKLSIGKAEYFDDSVNFRFDHFDIDCDKPVLEQFTGLHDKNGFTKIFEGDIIRLDGTIGGNIYEEKELLKDTTNLIIKGVGTSSWATTEQEAIMRGCHYAE